MNVTAAPAPAPVPAPMAGAPHAATADAVQRFLRERGRLLGDLACVDAVLAAWDEWSEHPDRRAGVTREALEELRALLGDDLARTVGG